MINYDDNDKTVDIPNFVENKDDDSTSVDMSIFNMSDDELYEDAKEDIKEKDSKKPSKKKSNSTLLLCLILICILIGISAGAIIFAVKQRGEVTSLKNQISQLSTQITELTTENSSLKTENKQLEEKLKATENAGTTSDPNNAYPKGTVLYITEDGSTQGVRVKADAASDTAIDSDGNQIVLYWGDSVTLIADATIDAKGTYWGKTDKGYIRIKVGEEIWATTEKQ